MERTTWGCIWRTLWLIVVVFFAYIFIPEFLKDPSIDSYFSTIVFPFAIPQMIASFSMLGEWGCGGSLVSIVISILFLPLTVALYALYFLIYVIGGIFQRG